MEIKDQIELLKERKIINYIFPMIIKLLSELECIITDLDNKTREERIVVTEEKKKNGKIVKHISILPLKEEDILNKIKENNIDAIIDIIKQSTNNNIKNQTISDNDIIELLENIHINTYNFEDCILYSKEREDLIALIINIRTAMQLSLCIGNGMPEKYNNIHRFLIKYLSIFLEKIGF